MHQTFPTVRPLLPNDKHVPRVGIPVLVVLGIVVSSAAVTTIAENTRKLFGKRGIKFSALAGCAETYQQERMPGRDIEQTQQRRLKIARAFQFIVYCWAMRLGIGAIGTVLVSLMQFIVPSEQGALRMHRMHVRQWVEVVRSHYEGLREPSEPVLFLDVGSIQPDLLKAKFRKVTPIDSTVLKMSSDPSFLYYDDSRLWSVQFEHERPYEYYAASSMIEANPTAVIGSFLGAKVDTRLSQAECDSDLSKDGGTCDSGYHYLYGTHSSSMQYLPALSPNFAQYISLEGSVPQVCMWFSSSNVTAGLHFDLNDNFLLQVSGEKAITIASPEAVSLVNPQSSWHPYWRQGHNVSGLSTPKKVLEHLNWRLDEEWSGNTTAANGNGSMQTARQRSSTAFGEVKVWEATLRPGDAIFIPAGYYHTVTSTLGSISLNTWFHSEFSDLYTQLENCPLPFAVDDAVHNQEASIAAMIRVVLTQLGITTSDFAAVARKRYAVLLPNSTVSDDEFGTMSAGANTAPQAAAEAGRVYHASDTAMARDYNSCIVVFRCGVHRNGSGRKT